VSWTTLPRTAAGTPLDVEGEAASEVRSEATESVDLVARWVALLDEAEGLLAAAVADPDDQATSWLQQTASRAFDALYASEHTMTPDARRAAREYVWRRDHVEEEPLPSELVLRQWEQCLCRRCHAARVLGRPVGDGPPARAAPSAPSVATATHVPRIPQVTPGRRTHAVQKALFPAASRQRCQRRHRIDS
jgi:hypothetical protein